MQARRHRFVFPDEPKLEALHAYYKNQLALPRPRTYVNSSTPISPTFAKVTLFSARHKAPRVSYEANILSSAA
ncbi:hypothetical protein NLJ89_g7608 [Agrocybe chaxingu]|uniref:Uncharacterized protein n=1 Tax=Agrocybe chaxingu TaxID=84603 RepID=A0A9W8K428_9AGAR|nr:hypothetical protein NLJ89_g7608 [Agrocybe chaxingu]